MKSGLFALLLLTPALAGCFGGSDDALDPGATDSAGELPTLPEGLEMEGAEVVSYNDTSVTWRWTGEIGPGALGPDADLQPRVTTTFDVPADLLLGIEGDLSWSDSDAYLGLRILDASGEQECLERRDSIGTIPGPYPPTPTDTRTCKAATAPLEDPVRWEVFVEARSNVRPATAFELLLTIRSGPHPAVEELEAGPSVPRGDHHTVLGFADTGINPYHVAFRDTSPEALQHPSTYLDGYPEDAVALDLTLDAPNLKAALVADTEIWQSVEAGQLYWVPGTRIVGLIGPGTGSNDGLPEDCPLLDCSGHGTFVASRGAGSQTSLCPDCLIAMAQAFETVDDFQRSFAWLAEQDWVDVSSNSWGTLLDYQVVSDEERADNDALAARKPTLFASGNGLGGGLGVVGQPAAATFYHQGLPHAITVGGHDNGKIATWPGSMPHVVADVCPAGADDEAIAETRRGTGTSHATPYASGAAARLVLEARRALDDRVGGVQGGVLARGSGAALENGPLADGELTTDELRRVLFTTAEARPGEGELDGPSCAPQASPPAPWSTSPVEWQAIPEGVPQYYFIGYGAVNENTVEHAKRVLRDEEPMPERPVEDAFFALDQEVRRALVEVDP